VKLVDLDPHWVSEPDRHGQGITFLCPCGCGERIGVSFRNPIDFGAPMASPIAHSGHWDRAAGDTFEGLTLTPSIDRPKHWHGWIRTGEVLTA
jgi:hypothetical protein